MAPQLTGTKGPAARGPLACSSRATSSLPVPDSPLMYTGAWLRESRTICWRSCTMGSVSPSSCTWSGHCSVALAAPRRSALVTRLRSRSRSIGLVRKSKAPAFIDSIARSTLPKAVITATGMPS